MESGHPRLDQLGAIAGSLWRAVLLLVPIGVVIFAVFVVAAARSNSALLNIDEATEVGDRAAAAVDAYVAHIVDDTRALASAPAVRDLANAPPWRLPAEEAQKLDEQWKQRRTSGASARVQGVIADILGRPVSRFFADLCDNKAGVVREILLTDRSGYLVAASEPTDNYDQHDEGWWYEAIGRGSSCASAKECAYAGDISFDSSLGALGFDVSVPVFDLEHDVVGVLKVVVDPRELAPLLALSAAKHPVTVALIRRDGTNVLNDGQPLLQNTSDATGKLPGTTLEDLRGLGGDQQITATIGGVVSPIRALSGPQFDKWAVVVRNRHELPIRGWLQIATLIAIIVAMFLISARAYALSFELLRRTP